MSLHWPLDLYGHSTSPKGVAVLSGLTPVRLPNRQRYHSLCELMTREKHLALPYLPSWGTLRRRATYLTSAATKSADCAPSRTSICSIAHFNKHSICNLFRTFSADLHPPALGLEPFANEQRCVVPEPSRDLMDSVSSRTGLRAGPS